MSQRGRAIKALCHQRIGLRVPFGYLLLGAAMFVASCTNARSTTAAPGQFGVNTTDGVVTARVDGFATGVTNQDLTRLVLAGVGESYTVDCHLLPNTSPDTTQMVWRVTNNGRKPTAIVSVELIQNGRTVRSAFADAAAPAANPDAVFVHQVATLARRVLPQPSTGAEVIPDRC
jgi:hypothetical protein